MGLPAVRYIFDKVYAGLKITEVFVCHDLSVVRQKYEVEGVRCGHRQEMMHYGIRKREKRADPTEYGLCTKCAQTKPERRREWGIRAAAGSTKKDSQEVMRQKLIKERFEETNWAMSLWPATSTGKGNKS